MINGQRYSAVTRSGRQMPQVAPASIAMLHRVIRDSMLMASTTGPANSMTLSVAPFTVSSLMMNEDHVLGVDAVRQGAGDGDPHGFRGAEGADALEDAHLQVGGADAGGKGAEGAVGAGVRIAHDDRVAGADKALFREQGMADAVGADVEKILDVVAPGPVAHDLALRGGLGILGRGDMVDDRLDLAGVKDPVHAAGLKIGDGNGRGDFVAHDHIDIKDTFSGVGVSRRCAAKIFSAMVLPIVHEPPCRGIVRVFFCGDRGHGKKSFLPYTRQPLAMINDRFRPKKYRDAVQVIKETLFFSYFTFDRSSQAVISCSKPEVLLPGTRDFLQDTTRHMARKKTKKTDRQLPAAQAANQQTVGLILAIFRDEYGEIPPRLAALFSDVADLYAGRWPSHEACAVTYHNFSHALDVCLAAARMLSGWNKMEQAQPLGREIFPAWHGRRPFP